MNIMMNICDELMMKIKMTMRMLTMLNVFISYFDDNGGDCDEHDDEFQDEYDDEFQDEYDDENHIFQNSNSLPDR